MINLFRKKEERNILDVEKQEKYRAIEELIKKSQPSSIYYTLLLLSSVIITGGILLGNVGVVIGGMLVTPFLTPIILIPLAIVTKELKTLKQTLLIVLQSIFIILFISISISFFLEVKYTPYYFSLFYPNYDLYFQFFQPGLRNIFLLYLLIAFSSGIAGTFAWVRKEISEVLPGIAISVSVVPPLCFAGIYIGKGIFGLKFYFLKSLYFLNIFFVNLIGIIIGSFIVFYLLRFYKEKKKVKKEIEEQKPS